ncbi:sulfite exporter TauE/SafE family protein [Chitiniphilus purpureus]|uniref:Probable membrane transporter protein n=1 Tax=Chitiniphilus purpureus TaxID=2981137 RepID=A0ABY6DM48_9NEIS|nr:sulfite exporter TauE/SafE family protein [Chitiniphilus sp. CD1]UXY15424.1 sulfite exporter TauE/SafE family protein [Chitiniphilus sp. CD1]
MTPLLTVLLACLGVGVLAGFLAGLLGVGGGLVIVPALLLVFDALGLAQAHAQHLALGTSLATIVVTSLSSLRAHHAHGAVRWPVFRAISPGIVLGTFLGAQLAGLADATLLKWCFVLFAYAVAAQMLLDARPRPQRVLPGATVLAAWGGLIGAVSSWVGIGGGSLSVPLLSWHNVPVKEAIGTSAAIGLPIALAGSAGYAVSGWGVPGLPQGSVGFIYLPALLGIALASFPLAKAGAALAHRLPVAVLKRCFAVLLLLLASRMLWQLLG